MCLKMKNKYPVTRYYGVPVNYDKSGNYIFEEGVKVHAWRNGKHTKGKFQGLGQLFLTENNLLVAIVGFEKMKFKDRHTLAPFERFTKESVPKELLERFSREDFK